MEQYLNYQTFLAFCVGISLGFVLGNVFSRKIQNISYIPIWQTVCGIIFIGVNVYSVLTGAEIPHIFNFMLAMAFGGLLGIDIVKYIPALQNIGKKE